MSGRIRTKRYDAVDWSKSSVQIAKELGVSYRSVQAARNMRGLPTGSRGGPKKQNADHP